MDKCVFIWYCKDKNIYFHNKEMNTLYTVVTFTYYIPPKQSKTREPEDKYCVLWCTYVREYIHDPIPLDKLKNDTALQYITWGLIWDSKIKRKTLR